MEWCGHTGITRDMSELPHTSSISTTSNLRSTWQTTPSRRSIQNMEGTRLPIRFPMSNFNAIWMENINRRGITSGNKLFPRWKLWRLMLPKVYTIKLLQIEKWIIFKYLGWISWSIKISNLGWLKSTQILVLRSCVLYSTRSFRIWWTPHSN